MTKGAIEESRALLTDFPDSSEFAAEFVRCFDASVSLEALRAEPLLAKHLTNIDVMLALSQHALKTRDYSSAMKLAKLCIGEDESRPTPYLVYGQAALLLADADKEAIEGYWRVSRQAELREALEILKKGKGLPKSSGHTVMMRNFCVLSGDIARILNEDEMAFDCFREAKTFQPGDPYVAFRLAGSYLLNGQCRECINELEPLISTTQLPATIIAMLAEAYAGIETVEADEALNDLSQKLITGDLVPQFESELPQLLDDMASKLVHRMMHTELRELLYHENASLLSPGRKEYYLSRLALIRDKQDEAKTYAAEAYRLTLESQFWSYRAQLGELLFNVGLFEECLVVFDAILSYKKLDRNVAFAIQAAQNTLDHGAVVRITSTLKENGVEDDQLYLARSGSVAVASPQQALDEIVDFQKRHPESAVVHRNLNLQRSLLALQVEDDDRVERSLDRLPDPKDVPLQNGFLMVSMLSRAGMADDAARYAYELWRRNPNEAVAHQALINVYLPINQSMPKDEEPTLVEDGVTITYQEQGENRDYYFVLESNSPVLPQNYELETSSDYVQKHLLGKKVGDEFDLPTPFAPAKKATITRIQWKEVHRMQVCRDEYQRRFVGQRYIRSIRVVDDEGNVDFKEIEAVLRSSAQSQLEVAEKYTSTLMPISFLDVLSKSPCTAKATLMAIRDPSLVVRCYFGDDAKRQKAQELLAKATKIVIDPTVVALLYAVGLTELLDRQLPWEVVVPDAVVDDAKLLHRQLADGQRIGLDQAGDLCVTENRGGQAEFSKLLRSLERLRQGDDGHLLLSLAAEKRNQLTLTLGSPTIHAAVMAQGSDALLWIDDGVVAGILALESVLSFESSVWSQAVLQFLKDRSCISREEYSRASLSLHVFRYESTLMSQDEVSLAGKLTDWNVDCIEMKAVIGLCGPPYTMTPQHLSFGVEICYQAAKADLLAAKRDAVYAAVLHQLLLHREFNARSIVEGGLVSCAKQVFRLFPSGLDDFLQYVDLWTSNHNASGGLIIPE